MDPIDRYHTGPVQSFCTQCGTALRPGDAFCGVCGAKIYGVVPIKETVTTPVSFTYSAPTQEPFAYSAEPDTYDYAPETSLAQKTYKFPIVPLIWMSLAAIYSFVCMVDYFDLLNFLDFSAMSLMVVGLIVCRNKKNILYGIGYLIMAALCILSHIVYPYAGIETILLYSVPISVFLTFIGISYLAASHNIWKLKLILSILIIVFDFFAMFIFSFGYDIWQQITDFAFATVLPMFATILYTPFENS